MAGPAPAGYHSHLSGESQAQRYAQALQELAFGHARVALAYDDAVHQLGPGEQVRYGQDEVQQFWVALFGAFQVTSFEVEHLAFQQGGGRADRAALRWRARAVHAGGTMFGTPSGKPLEILGINHVEFFRGRVLREWVLLDEVALWM